MKKQNIKKEEAKGNLARLTKGLKLQYKEANAFIDMLLKALTIEDGEEDIPFIIKKNSEKEFTDESFNSQVVGGKIRWTHNLTLEQVRQKPLITTKPKWNQLRKKVKF